MALKTTSLNQDQLKSLERALADAYNYAGLQDIHHDKKHKQREDFISNIDNPSYSRNNKTKIENFKRHLPWKLKDARVEGITDLQSFFSAIEKKSTADLKSYPNLANLKENLLNKVTVESPAPTSNPPPPTRNAPTALSTSRTSSKQSEAERVSGSSVSTSSSSRLDLSPRPVMPSPSPASNSSVPPNFSVQDSSEKSVPASPWYSMVSSLLGQNNQIQVIEKESSKKTDDNQGGFLSVLANWGALAGGLLKKQEEGKPVLPPQKYPPKPVDTSTANTTQRREVPKVATVATKPNPQSPKTKASEYYSHSFDICRLQKKFDDNHNISYDQIENDKTYFDQRVAKWDAELKDIGLKTAPPRRPNEQRLMGFEGYIKYLDSNIKQLQTQELTQKELESGKNPSVNQQKLKTLIAFHYLEMAKAFYSSGELNMDKNDGDYQIKSKVFKGSSNYHEDLLDERMKISIDSYKLPKIDRERDYEKRRRIEELRNKYLPKHWSRIESRNLAKLYAKPDPAPPKDSRVTTLLNSAKGVLGDAKESIKEGLWEDYNRYGGARIASGLNSAKEGVTKIGDFVGRRADNVAEGMVWTGRRADPAKGGVNAGEIINKNTGLGFANPNADAREHDVGIHTHRKQTEEFQPNRDMRPDALARRNEASKVERYGRQVNSGLRKMYSETNGDFHIREGVGNPFVPGGRGGGGR